ncbi:MAG: branched-chain amino acid ABC transporter permease, partial [Nitrospinota bacterium]
IRERVAPPSGARPAFPVCVPDAPAEGASLSVAGQVVLQILNGFVWGWILALISLGLSLIFGLLQIINIAHGTLYMLGAVLAWFILEWTGSYWLALALAPLLVGLLGMAVERTLLRPIEKNPEMTIIATFALLLIVQQTVLLTFGGTARRIAEPIRFQLAFGPSGEFGYSGYRLVVAAFAVLAIGATWAFLHRTRAGLWIRAVKQDREMALALGIPVSAVYTLTFGLGAALAALSGVLAAPIVAVDFRMGIDVIISAFIVVIIGGVGSLKGSVVSALLVGELVGVASIFLAPTLAQVVALLVMAGILLFRPQGLFQEA